MRVEALFVAQAKVGFEFAVTDLNLPALPGPEEQGVERKGELPGTVVCRLGIDQEGQRFTARAGVSFAAHHD